MTATTTAPGRVPSRQRVLTVAGTDPTGGAGVAADLKTFAAHGAYGAAVVTAIVVQDTLDGVRSVHVPPPDVLADQLDAVSGDVALDAVKIGMLGSAENGRVVAAWLDRLRAADVPASAGPGTVTGRPFVVLDPVLGASVGGARGGALSRDPAAETLAGLRDVAARADVVTPNLAELGALLGEGVAGDPDAALAQGVRLADRLSSWRPAGHAPGRGEVLVLVTGGHLGGDRSPDLLVGPDGVLAVLDGPRLDVVATHGTGCGLSSALAALRPVRGSWPDAARDAKEWLTGALRDGDALVVGRGTGPVDHLHGLGRP
ncbi:bifunctional hydroxymethylpyrimidine kinase/phosphomethylpyrimidine kinase [Luteimicrobium subarcticum]|uniref:Hydroxymethylpyrimidine/phosphomethylpyrimidine kinase n=1 Tax=Luteimicrobium subarcticum TaxID=620910 RepID=A0A2M8WTS4_9MICO|nr:bifunctional hydroxymethylpyrimidine kinase/phosphomethylpyrimidine kinase [Luteimicrobium subarcticum]PJI94299.1 hydroxymethylpyrimidine/phosphomethylpyrimidine kinase [Luteimicrobium subarcticum]